MDFRWVLNEFLKKSNFGFLRRNYLISLYRFYSFFSHIKCFSIYGNSTHFFIVLPGYFVYKITCEFLNDLALNQVRGWLEALHNRRRRSEAAYQSRRTLLDQWADVCALRKELGSAEKQLDNLNRHHENSALGDSSATAEMLLFDHNKLLPEFRVSSL